MKRTELALLCAFIISVLLSLFSTSTAAFDKELDEMRTKVLRLHILANSDSEEDQALKISVRDEVLRKGQAIFTERDKKDAVYLCNENLEGIRDIAQKEVYKRGYNYKVKAYIDNRYFDTRIYEDITMPCGFYDALVIEIGEAKGKNWWCVMFPPLCIPSCSGDPDYNKEELKIALSEEESDMLVGDKYQFRFKSVEIFNDIKNRLSELF